MATSTVIRAAWGNRFAALVLCALPGLPALAQTQRFDSVRLGTASSITGTLDFYNSASTFKTTLQAGNAGASVIYTLPTAAPAGNGYCLVATTGGVMSWTTCDAQNIATSASPTFVGLTLTGLTPGRVPYATTGGQLIDDGDLTFATDTLTATKLAAPTSATVGTTTTAGTATSVLTSTMSGSSTTSNFFKITGTMPDPSADENGVLLAITGGGSSIAGVTTVSAARIQLLAGYTGARQTAGLYVQNQAASQGVAALGQGQIGVLGETSGTNTTGGSFSVGLYGLAGLSSNAPAVGVVGVPNQTTSANLTIGVMGLNGKTGGAGSALGGFFSVGTTTPPANTGVTAALMADNGTAAADIFVARDNSATPVLTASWAGTRVQDGGQPQNGLGVLTNGAVTVETAGELRSVAHSYTISAAQVAALGGTGAGDLTVATLPAKTVVKNAYIIVLTPDGSANALTVALGRVSATYIDYIVASDAKAVANTVYGDASGERGTNLTGYDLPSYTGTTAVMAHFIKTTTNLSTVTNLSLRVILETVLVP